WPFINDGTYAAHGGMCAGMSIGAAYFYRDFKGTLQLRSHFDNDQYWFQTPKVWQDDANGLKFCAELQHAFITTSDIWERKQGSPLIPLLNRSEEDHFWSLCYALLVNNQPQFIFLAVRNDYNADAHAIIAYAYEILPGEGRLKVYDPNSPGKEGTIIFDFSSGKFRPYTSAANASALADGRTFNYNEIVFIPLSTLCNMKDIDRIWQKVADRTVGAGQYPEYELWAVPVDNEDLPRVKLLDAADGKTTYLPYRDFTVEIIQKDAGIPTTLTAWVDLPDIKEIERQEPASIIVLERPDKDNLVGIQVNAIADDATNYSWAGFQWFKIRMQSLWLEPADTTVNMNQELRLVLRHNSTAPQNARFVWDFGDGTTKTTIGDSTNTHTWTELGEYTVRVEMFEGNAAEAIGSALATVNVTAYSSIFIMLQGMTTTPPSTIKDTNGEDISQIGWANTDDNPPLVWNKQNFSVDMKKTVHGVEVNTSISGRLSDDGSSIATMTAITSSVGYGGDFMHNSAIVITDFPLGEFGVVSPLGRGLHGPAAQARVANISWRTETRDNEGNTKITEIESIDWSSDKTTLSVYFFQ
ncbi:MAG: PKD domain-containing protein, partial [Bacteroidetes bacterium]|nr:PKD domain-containing protein [Bacteroidota bacterium]